MTLSRNFRRVALVLAVTAPFTAIAQPNFASHSTWIRPYSNVKMETSECGGKLCGWVVWATPDAEQDAREGGVQKLVGTELLQDYRQTASNRWQGRVFVPDMGRTFYSTITQIDPDALKISGCIMGGLLCKSQVWHKA